VSDELLYKLQSNINAKNTSSSLLQVQIADASARLRSYWI